jgi:hypothetical protein
VEVVEVVVVTIVLALKLTVVLEFAKFVLAGMGVDKVFKSFIKF